MHQVLDAELLDKALVAVTGAAGTFGAPVGIVVFAPGARVTFVGSDQVGGAIHLECGHGIRQVQAADTGPGIDIDDAIVIGYVSAVTINAQILFTQRQDVGDGGAGDIQLGQDRKSTRLNSSHVKI